TEWGMLCLCAMLWGSAYVFNAIAIRELPHLTITLARLVIAAAFMQIVLRWAGLRLSRDPKIWAAFFVMTLLSNIGPYLLVLKGQMGTTSGLAAVLTATTPLFTILLAHWFTRDERLTVNKFVGVLVGIAGVAIVVGSEAWAGLSGSSMAKLTLVAASFLYAVGSIYAKRFSDTPPLVIAASVMLSGAIVALPLALLVDRPWALPMPSLDVIVAVLLTGVFGSALAAITYFRVFTVSGATNAMLVTLLLPVTPVIGGALYLGERLELREILGAIVIMLALAIIDGRILKRILG
ncbi:MAG: EamA family transporter, partial [Hyphomicrobiaceae bacterium]